MSSPGKRKDLVTARESLQRAAAGYEDVDFATAASMLDRVLATSCPHDSLQAHQSSVSADGRPLVTCTECGVSWYADFPQRLKV
jgi:hypothetical protein